MKILNTKQQLKVWWNGQKLCQGTRIWRNANGDFTYKNNTIKLHPDITITVGDIIQVEKDGETTVFKTESTKDRSIVLEG